MECFALQSIPAPDKNAILILDISYRNHVGMNVSVKLGTPVYVDTKTGIALIGDDHIDLGHWEYIIIEN